MKFCSLCKHQKMIEDEIGEQKYPYYYCMNPVVLRLSSTYLVNGDADSVHCEDARSADQVCGLLGELWEEKE